MYEVVISDSDVKKAAEQGMDDFIHIFVEAIYKAIGDKLTAENMANLNADQNTLLAYVILRDEVMDGGFVQLIHNGYGAFIFKNPFSKMMRKWGIDDLAKLINKVHKSFSHHHEEIEKECSYDEFMALFERFPEFDNFDDDFVENEEQWTTMVAYYIDEHIGSFAKIRKNGES